MFTQNFKTELQINATIVFENPHALFFDKLCCIEEFKGNTSNDDPYQTDFIYANTILSDNTMGLLIPLLDGDKLFSEGFIIERQSKLDVNKEGVTKTAKLTLQTTYHLPSGYQVKDNRITHTHENGEKEIINSYIAFCTTDEDKTIQEHANENMVADFLIPKNLELGNIVHKQIALQALKHVFKADDVKMDVEITTNKLKPNNVKGKGPHLTIIEQKL